MIKEYVKHYLFLENLRRSGIINMFGAVPYLMDQFNIDKNLATIILSNWMNNYSEIEKYLEDNNLIDKRI